MVNSSKFSEDIGDFRRFSRILKGAATLSFIIISFGSLVRASSAGLACPDWPLCFGKLLPTFDYQIFLEWFHRLLAGGLGVLLLYGTSVLIRSRSLRSSFGLQLLVALVLLGIQIVLGGLTVLKLLDAKTVGAHLVNAILFFSVIVWMMLRSGQIADSLSHIKVQAESLGLSKCVKMRTFRKIIVAFLTLVFFQLAVGGMVSTNYAGLACPDFPKCHGQWVPPFNFHLWLQVAHRLLGILVGLLSIMVAYTGWKALEAHWENDRLANLSRSSRSLKRMVYIRRVLFLLPGLIAFQILLGVLNVLYFLPTSITVMHLANAVGIYTLTLTVVIYLFEPVFAEDWKVSYQMPEAMPQARSALRVGDVDSHHEDLSDRPTISSLTNPSPQL